MVERAGATSSESAEKGKGGRQPTRMMRDELSRGGCTSLCIGVRRLFRRKPGPTFVYPKTLSENRVLGKEYGRLYLPEAEKASPIKWTSTKRLPREPFTRSHLQPSNPPSLPSTKIS